MEKTKQTLLILIICLLAFSSCAMASKITFIDTAGIENGTMIITASNGTVLSILNSSESFDIFNDSVHHLDYQSSGLYALHNEVVLGYENGTVITPELNGINFYIKFWSKTNNIVMLIFVILCLLIMVLA